MSDAREKPHWQAYERARDTNPDLIDELADEIVDFAEKRSTFTSREAGRAILDQWDRKNEWNQCFGGLARAVFGIVLYETLSDDFSIEEPRVGQRTEKRYRRV